jgi:hypothetical protein
LDCEGAPLGRSFETLPPARRAKFYRQFARDALRKARIAKEKERRAEYFAMAAGWHLMATELERNNPSLEDSGLSGRALYELH